VDVRIVELDDPIACRAAAALFADVWGSTPVTGELLRALGHSGHYVVGAYDGEQLIGASVAFATADGSGELHSHITAVAPGLAGRGLGLTLKGHQRAWAAEHGLVAVRWTFDPLVRRNAWFNITKLGVAVEAYLPDFYGPMDDAINRGEASDRLLVRWAVSDEPPPPPGEAELTCATPEDIEALRAADPTAASAWRAAVRDGLGGAFADGYGVVGFTKEGEYQLARRP
jgi:predicted GNAT superfamily acetyltransferase